MKKRVDLNDEQRVHLFMMLLNNGKKLAHGSIKRHADSFGLCPKTALLEPIGAIEYSALEVVASGSFHPCPRNVGGSMNTFEGVAEVGPSHMGYVPQTDLDQTDLELSGLMNTFVGFVEAGPSHIGSVTQTDLDQADLELSGSMNTFEGVAEVGPSHMGSVPQTDLDQADLELSGSMNTFEGVAEVGPSHMGYVPQTDLDQADLELSGSMNTFEGFVEAGSRYMGYVPQICDLDQVDLELGMNLDEFWDLMGDTAEIIQLLDKYHEEEDEDLDFKALETGFVAVTPISVTSHVA